MANRRRTPAARPRRRRSSGLPTFRIPAVAPEVVRSLVGLSLAVLGILTLVALLLPGEGSLNTWWIGTVAPWFGSLRWLLPFLLFGAGWYVEWGPGRHPGSGWGLTPLGVAIAYAGLLGGASVVTREWGGRVGRFLADLFQPMLAVPGALVVLGAICVVGVLLAFNLRLSDLTRPGLALARWLGATAATSIQRQPGATAAGSTATPAARGGASSAGTAAIAGEAAGPNGARGRGPRIAGSAEPLPGQTGIWGEDGPVPIPSSVPTSATFAPTRSGTATAGAATVLEPPRRRDPDDVTDASDSPPTRERQEYVLPPIALLDAAIEIVEPGGEEAVHLRNQEIITRKLASFDLPVVVVGRNAGPVVTQYEVQPAPHVKVSRIEALSDDLAMALAARSLRIEAPIPGKSAVGIEIPNKDFNVVTLRGILETLDFAASGSRLTFALGRDVAGRAQAVDLAKMPHLLIAGATGSGKSVMVNALITSLLCNATPDDLRMIVVDLKRVELAQYNGLPHLLVPVITETERAKAALKWAVNEMEGRYRRFAGASARNIRAYNETRIDPADRMPNIIIVIDELADLMMREGKNVEEAIVRLAQKARATGIHMVVATQRPSVNVVTGLIKANFPSRIAFAMASQIDSRTILDTPGAEDLIGRGDMLYQPADLPRP
ncbi:MAG TPA: DNA translocase FtsK, partial [Candidatus Eisenbacteria bacterium]|nr:DNA translocase FtsK [Candidatus Eisenbacteria bacterium]